MSPDWPIADAGNSAREGNSDRPVASRPNLSSGTLAIPIEGIFLHVTKACNLRCTYCYFSATRRQPDEMSASEFSPLWPDIVALHPKKAIFTGGEPLLRPDILTLLRGLREADPQHRVRRCLNTNGHLVTVELARQLVGLVDEIRVSLDALPQRNDSLRGPGNFDAAVRALECLQAVGFEPKVLVTVTAPALPDLEALLCFLIQKGITRIVLNDLRPIGRARVHPEWAVEADAVWGIVQRAWEKCNLIQPLPPAPVEHLHRRNCGVGSFVNVLPSGDVFPCHVLTLPEFYCGNLREQSLLEICRSSSLLGELQTLDFRLLAARDKRLAGLMGYGRCMGSVYAQTRSLPVWRSNLSLSPLLGVRRMSAAGVEQRAHQSDQVPDVDTRSPIQAVIRGMASAVHQRTGATRR